MALQAAPPQYTCILCMSLLVGSFQRMTVDNVSLNSQLAVAEQNLTITKSKLAIAQKRICCLQHEIKKHIMVNYYKY